MSPRQRLKELVESGKLRQQLEYSNLQSDEEVVSLIVDVCLRYCASRRKP
jgi:hypothetical protein